MRELIGQKPIVECTGKQVVSDTQHYVRTRELRTLAKHTLYIYFRLSLAEVSFNSTYVQNKKHDLVLRYKLNAWPKFSANFVYAGV